jgi:ATP-binding cassette subfamily B protein
VFGSYAFIAYQTVQGLLTIGDLVMYFGAVQRGQSLLQSAFSAAAGLYEDNLFIGMLDEFFSLEPVVRAPERPKPVPDPIREGFAVEGVSFRYPTSDRDLIHDVSLDIGPGEMVALIGANGSGKTTLVKLLSRFYDPDDGVVTLDGVDLRDMDPREYRRRIAVVFQDFSRVTSSPQLGGLGRTG